MEQQRLLMKLLPFYFTIIYKAGKENIGADAFSRRPQHADFLTLAMPTPLVFGNLKEALEADPYTKQLSCNSLPIHPLDQISRWLPIIFITNPSWLYLIILSLRIRFWLKPMIL